MSWFGYIWRQEGIFSKRSQALGSWGSFVFREEGPCLKMPLPHTPSSTGTVRASKVDRTPAGLCEASSQRAGPSVVGRAGWDIGDRPAGRVWWGAIYLLGSLAWAQPSGICLHDLIKPV